MSEIFLPTDMEANGPVAPDYSMLGFASHAYILERGKFKLKSSFARNLELLPGAKEHPVQMEWWTRFPNAWNALRENPQPPEQAMREYHEWLQSLGGNIVFLARPVAYDHAFMRWYFIHFLGINPPFGHRGLDVQSYVMGMMRSKRFSEAGKLLETFRDPSLSHPHIPFHDALDEFAGFANAYNENMRLRRAEALAAKKAK